MVHLIVAQSGRMLAQAAFGLGLKVWVIDCYQDVDTQYYAPNSYKIATLAKVHLMPIVEVLIQQYGITKVIVGSGLETFPDSLQYLAARLRLLGNHPAVWERLSDKRGFFQRLDYLDIPYPKVRFKHPCDETDWLVKPQQGQGGEGIHHDRLRSNNTEYKHQVYWQQYQAGSAHSVLFLADKKQAQIIGFNTQWCCAFDDDRAFIFSGIRTGTDLSLAQQAMINNWVKKLVLEYALIGLNTVDFISTDQHCWLLEINPRPSASMQLYSAAWLGQHIQICLRGHLNKATLLPYQCATRPLNSGYQVVYAPQEVRIPQNFTWPVGCVDLPKAGAIIATTQPICSIIANAQCSSHLMALLQTRQQSLLSKLTKSI